MPKPIVFDELRRRMLPTDCLALPAGFQTAARPDIVSPTFDAAPKELAKALQEIAVSQARTTIAAETSDSLRLELVRRSRVFRFPDRISIQVLPAENGGSSLAIYSAAKYGLTDFGVNRRHVQALLAALMERVPARNGSAPSP